LASPLFRRAARFEKSGEILAFGSRVEEMGDFKRRGRRPKRGRGDAHFFRGSVNFRENPHFFGGIMVQDPLLGSGNFLSTKARLQGSRRVVGI